MKHIPVLLDKVLATLGDPPSSDDSGAAGLRGKTIVDATFGAGVSAFAGMTIIDATFGGGGYTRAFLERGANVIAFDRDSSVAPIATEIAKQFPNRFQFINAPFSEIAHLNREAIAHPLAGGASCEATGGGLASNGEQKDANNNFNKPSPAHFASCPPRKGVGIPASAGIISAIVFDFGVSSMQIDTPERGFSFRFDAPLDMRMQQSAHSPQPTAAELIESTPLERLVKILRDYGDVKKATPIARAMKDALPRTTFELRDLIYDPRDVANVFQALRIAVNDELGEIERALDSVPELLSSGGMCVCVSFHSLEDRIVKSKFREWTTPVGDPRIPLVGMGCQPVLNPGRAGSASLPPFQLLKTFRPDSAELNHNPRARSSHLRAVRKI